MILVVGSTGLLGTAVCRRLAARGRPTRAFVRTTSDPAKVGVLKALGVEIVEGDLRDRGSLATACRGVDAIISSVSSMPFAYEPGVNDIATTDLAGVTSLIDAATAAGVRRFVYTSFSGNIDRDCPLRSAKRTVEAYVRDSGLEYTILRPSVFMDVWLSPAVGFDAANARATIYGTGTSPISWIAVDDVAEFAVRSLDAPAARNAILELGGPEPLTPLQAVAIFERAGGRHFDLQFVPDEALQAQEEAATDPMARSFSALMRCYAAGDPIPMGPMRLVFPFPMTSLEQYAERTLGTVVAPV